jgi:hypothetical protein
VRRLAVVCRRGIRCSLDDAGRALARSEREIICNDRAAAACAGLVVESRLSDDVGTLRIRALQVSSALPCASNRAGVRRGIPIQRFGKLVTQRRGWRRAVATLVALASACVAAPALAGEGGLTIETGSPDALCPELASTRAAVSRRLGELIVPGGSSGFLARYTIAHAPVGSPRDFVRLELYGPEGTLQLSRDLPLEGESCGTMAEVIALVLDRYFRALLAHDPPSSDADGPAPAAAPAAASPPPSPTPDRALPAARETSSAPGDAQPSDAGPRRDASEAPAASGSRRLALAAFELGFRSPDMPALGARAMLELWPQVYLGTALHVGLRSKTENLSDSGEVSSRDASWRLNAGWGPRLGPVRTYVGPGVCLGIARGSGDGLPQRNSGYRATWTLGLDAGAQWVTDDGWSFGAAAALDISVLSGRFYIDGQEVLAQEPVRGWFGMSLGHAF